jgi:hypothetical protein
LDIIIWNKTETDELDQLSNGRLDKSKLDKNGRELS